MFIRAIQKFLESDVILAVCAAQACFSFSISEEVFFTGQAALALEF
jgi:hypothetical protein